MLSFAAVSETAIAESTVILDASAFMAGAAATTTAGTIDTIHLTANPVIPAATGATTAGSLQVNVNENLDSVSAATVSGALTLEAQASTTLPAVTSTTATTAFDDVDAQASVTPSAATSTSTAGTIDTIHLTANISITGVELGITPSAPSLNVNEDLGSVSATFSLGADAHPTFTAFGDAQLSTAQKKFGTSSLLLDGTGDYVKSSANNLQDANFTVEFWIYTSNRLQDAYLWDGQVSNSGLALAITSLGKIRIIKDNTILGTFNNNLSDNTWHHIALVANSTLLTVWIDGSPKGQATILSGIDSYPNQPYYIGCRHNETQFFNGYIDEFRATNTSLYMFPFIPVTSALTDTGDTNALLHFDGTNGSTTITSTDTVDAITANGKANLVLPAATATTVAGTAGFDAKANITLDAATADADLTVNDFADEDAQASTTLSGVSAASTANWDTVNGVYAVQVVYLNTDFERTRTVNVVPYGNYKVYVTR